MKPITETLKTTKANKRIRNSPLLPVRVVRAVVSWANWCSHSPIYFGIWGWAYAAVGARTLRYGFWVGRKQALNLGISGRLGCWLFDGWGIDGLGAGAQAFGWAI